MRILTKCLGLPFLYTTTIIVCVLLFCRKESHKPDGSTVPREQVGENLISVHAQHNEISKTSAIQATALTHSVKPEWAWFGRDCSGLILGSFRTTVIPPAEIESAALPQSVIAGVKYFAIFLGFGRGGTTLVGALLDAHPNIVLATDYQLFIKWPQWSAYHQQVTFLYTAIYHYSISYAKYFRRSKTKGYSFDLPGGFNGRYNKSISVIGEKEAGSATVLYMNRHLEWLQTLKELQSTVKVPIKAVQVLRNPVDTIATQMAYETFGEVNKSRMAGNVLINNSALLDAKIESISCCYEAVQHIQQNPDINIDVYQLHLADLIRDPYGEMEKLCNFFEVECFEWYLDACAGLIQRKLTKSRHHVIWSEEQIRRIENNMRRLPFLSRYSFTSED